jgi:hypothetical protein
MAVRSTISRTSTAAAVTFSLFEIGFYAAIIILVVFIWRAFHAGSNDGGSIFDSFGSLFGVTGKKVSDTLGGAGTPGESQYVSPEANADNWASLITGAGTDDDTEFAGDQDAWNSYLQAASDAQPAQVSIGSSDAIDWAFDQKMF